jgi:hypothetical protein
MEYPAWQAEYAAAIVETDPAKLKSKIELAEVALFRRAKELSTPPDDPERLAMRDAASALRVLLVQVLGYPDLPK